MADSGIRYVWGQYINSRAREVYAMNGVMRCALYTAYFGSRESHVVKLYPKRLLIRGSISDFNKKTVALRDIEHK